MAAKRISSHTKNAHNRFLRHIEERRRLSHEEHKIHAEYHRKINQLLRERDDVHRYQRHIKYTRPLILIINLFIWYLIFRYFGVKVISIIFALLITIGGFMEVFFLANLQKRIFKPISKLRLGVEEVAKGNYDVQVDCFINNEIGVLVESFNDMARKLKESESLKHEYEENRKALIANISHDLKTPITSIQGYIETMADRTDISQETINKYHQIIYNNAAYMNKLIDDLFLFSKLDMQKLELQFEQIGIRAFMNDLMEEFKFELEDKRVNFNYEDELKESPVVVIDRKRIHQIFSNLIGNAVKYGYEEDTTIKVRLYMDSDFINIDIEDNGTGIPEDKLPYIFNRFYRVDYARTKNLMSTGLGLAIAKELVEAHGGKISVRSKENEGTCFTVMLPILNELKGEEQ